MIGSRFNVIELFFYFVFLLLFVLVFISVFVCLFLYYLPSPSLFLCLVVAFCLFVFTQFIFRISLVPIGLSRVQVVPANTTPKFQTKLGEAQIIRTTGQKNNNNKSLGTATITTTTTSPGGHIVKGKQKKFNILLEHNYA